LLLDTKAFLAFSAYIFLSEEIDFHPGCHNNPSRVWKIDFQATKIANFLAK